MKLDHILWQMNAVNQSVLRGSYTYFFDSVLAGLKQAPVYDSCSTVIIKPHLNKSIWGPFWINSFNEASVISLSASQNLIANHPKLFPPIINPADLQMLTSKIKVMYHMGIKRFCALAKKSLTNVFFNDLISS